MGSVEGVGSELVEIADETDKLVEGPMTEMRTRLDEVEGEGEQVFDELHGANMAMAILSSTLKAQRSAEANAAASLNGLSRRLDQVAKGTDNEILQGAQKALHAQAGAMTEEHRTAAKHEELLGKAAAAIEVARLAVEQLVELGTEKRDRIEGIYLSVGGAATDIRDVARDM